MSWAAHELEAYLFQWELKGKARLRTSFLAVLLGCYLPDLVTKIFVFGIHVGPIHVAPQKYPWRYHRGFPGVGFTHSLFFGALVALFVLWKWRSREWFLGILIGSAAHVLTDMFDSIGTMVFFPFTTQHYSFGMWAYAAQQGPNGDGAAYYSSLGGPWDAFWLVLLLLNWRVLTRKYFFEKVVPDDAVWGWFQRKFRMSNETLLALYRAYFYYGACRIFAWFFWARWIDKVPLDLSWGGPYWVNKAPSYHFTFYGLLANTLVGVLGLTVASYLIWRYIGRRWWDRAIDLNAPQPAAAA